MTPEERAAIYRAAASETKTHGPWSHSDYLQAEVIDRLTHLAWMQSDGKSKPPPPYPRPGVDEQAVTPINERAKAYMAYVREHHGAAPPEGWEPALADG